MSDKNLDYLGEAIDSLVGQKGEVEECFNKLFEDIGLEITVSDLDAESLMRLFNTVASCSLCNKIAYQKNMWYSGNYYNQDQTPLFCGKCADLLFRDEE